MHTWFVSIFKFIGVYVVNWA